MPLSPTAPPFTPRSSSKTDSNETSPTQSSSSSIHSSPSPNSSKIQSSPRTPFKTVLLGREPPSPSLNPLPVKSLFKQPITMHTAESFPSQVDKDAGEQEEKNKEEPTLFPMDRYSLTSYMYRYVPASVQSPNDLRSYTLGNA